MQSTRLSLESGDLLVVRQGRKELAVFVGAKNEDGCLELRVASPAGTKLQVKKACPEQTPTRDVSFSGRLTFGFCGGSTLSKVLNN